MTAPNRFFIVGQVFLAGLALLATGCAGGKNPREKDKVVLEYWEKWTGHEKEAITRRVEAFNRSQNKIYVRLLTVSRIDQKMMLATAGRVPPDVVGLWSVNLPSYSENNALLPLDRLAREFGLSEDQYLPVIWKLCNYRGFLWALPSTPSVVALHWNKDVFREAGLDPEQPPRTLAELEAFNEKIALKNADGSLTRIGHMPQEPAWWMRDFPTWFGHPVWEGGDRMLMDDDACRNFFGWLESYPRRFGGPEMYKLRGAFGNFASPENPFFTGKVAMIMQGVWMDGFIRKFAKPGFRYGVAPFPEPVEHPGAPLTVAETDILVIPAGAKHPRESMEFIAWMQQQENMEALCLDQKKISPLRETSADFLARHDHPYLSVFQKLAASPRAQPGLCLPTLREYENDLSVYTNLVLLGRMSGEAARTEMSSRQQKALDAKLGRWNRVAPVRTAEWRKEVGS